MKLKEIRRAKKLTQAKLGRMSGVPLRTIQDIERRRDCRVSTAIVLAEALGVSMDELCEKDEKCEEANND